MCPLGPLELHVAECHGGLGEGSRLPSSFPAPAQFTSPLQEDVQQLQSMLACELQAMLCVPVISRATDQVVALACAFNKLGGDL